MKKAAIIACIVAVGVVGILVGVGVSNDVPDQTDYERTLQESVSSKSEPQTPSPNGTTIVREIGETVEGSNTPKP